VFASRAPQKDIERVKARMGWEMPSYTMTDGFDANHGVDEWHGTNAFIRDGDGVFRTYFINARGDEAMGSTGATSTSPRSGAQRSGRTRRTATPKPRRTSGGPGTTNHADPRRLDRALVSRLLRVILAVAVASVAAVAVSLPTYAVRPAARNATTCRSAALARTTATNKPSYVHGAPITISTSVVNVSRRTCAVDIQACVSATVTNRQGTVVWSAVPFNALCAQYIVHQTLTPGQSVTRSWTWDQHVCVLVGKCPGPQVAAGRYVAQGHWGGGIGDARPTSFTIKG
jgi:uncharacterized protein DUF899